jgi:hypothetical protein
MTPLELNDKGDEVEVRGRIEARSNRFTKKRFVQEGEG